MVGKLYLLLYLIYQAELPLIIELDVLPCLNILFWRSDMSRDQFAET